MFLFPEKTDCKEVLRIAREYDVQIIFKLVDEYLYIYAKSSTCLLALADEFGLQLTKEKCCKYLIQSSNSAFEEKKWECVNVESKALILGGIMKEVNFADYRTNTKNIGCACGKQVKNCLCKRSTPINISYSQMCVIKQLAEELAVFKTLT